MDNVRRKTQIENVCRDFRFAFRLLLKDWRFTLIAVLTIAIGIASSAVAFSAFYNFLFNAFTAKDANRLVVLTIQNAEIGASSDSNLTPLGGSVAELDLLRNQTRAFEDIVGYHRGIALLHGGESILQVHYARVTSNAFDFYGVPPLIGRGIEPSDGSPSASPVFVMNYKTWKGEFNSDSSVIGKTYLVDGVSRTLIGIMRPRFQAYGALVQIWIPIPLDAAANGNNSRNTIDTMMARLKPGVTVESASADINLAVNQLAKNHPADFPDHFSVKATPATQFLMGPYGIGSAGGPETQHFDLKHMLYVLLLGAIVLLLIACGNVANLLLSRATTRDREFAVRAALGATRGRLVWQLSVESCTLALVGGALGCALAYFGTKAVAIVVPHKGISIGGETVIGLNWPILLFALFLVLVTTVLCGLVPAVSSMRRYAQPNLAAAGHAIGSDHRRARLRSVLVVGQVAFSILLLIGAGLMIRSYFRLTHIALGFNPQKLLLLGFDNSSPTTFSEAQPPVPIQTIAERLKQTPGVADVAINNSLPGYNSGLREEVSAGGSTHVEQVGLNGCSESLLHVLELQMERGRWLSPEDVTHVRHVAVINRTMALRFFGDSDPVGREFTAKGMAKSGEQAADADFQVIGVLRDVKNLGPQVPVVPMAFVPYTVTEGIFGGNLLFVKSNAPPASLTRPLQEQIRAFDRNVIFYPESGPYIETLRSLTYSPHEFGLMTFAPLAGVALFLLVMGIVCVMAYNVSLLTREIGVRVALGAQSASILALVLAKGLRLLIAGAIIGVFASYALTRFLANQIWGIATTDPWTFVSAASVVLVAGIAACAIPARRAARLDPMEAIRCE